MRGLGITSHASPVYKGSMSLMKEGRLMSGACNHLEGVAPSAEQM
jgi:hypothetical protein